MGRMLLFIPVVALVLGGSTACATKKYVQGRVAEVNDKVGTMGKSLEETQERVRQNETRLGEVDEKAASAGRSAEEARSAATTANAKAESVDARAKALATELDRATKRLIYEVTLSEDQGNFKFGTAKLPDDARTEIDKLVDQLKTDPKGAFIEIEGHTDSTGSKMVNERLGLERAEAVKRYLYEQHQVPLHKINVISYGEEKPVAPNNSRTGRAQNRRVVIKVLI